MSRRLRNLRRIGLVVSMTAIFASAMPVAAASADPPPIYFTIRDTDKWAGYGVSGLSSLPRGVPYRAGDQPFVQGTWEVPAVSCVPGIPSLVAVWVGLGGVNAPLEQIATVSECDVFGNAKYSAYLQLTDKGLARLVEDEQGNPYPVMPGDRITGSVGTKGDGTYEFLMFSSRPWYFTATEEGSSDKAAWDTAEWIVEAATVGNDDYISQIRQLANFNVVGFTDCYTRHGPISEPEHTVFQYQLSRAAPNNVSKASPGAITEPSAGPYNGSHFAVTWRPI